ncbi:hypothetical protein BMS3Abin16_00863 [archaeon BMS3Abin16]|nr:hypothetical protein BMS3Abin16_00863 [archaeon BMS3Abin16]GBE56286.1 hypothetical protein BMS3Bbin16_00486 [archaeon BMS3Bbin16]HDY73704.1 hypothetical protein [Euryarchaeota archaeon]
MGLTVFDIENEFENIWVNRIRKELNDENLLLYREADLQASLYYWLRKFFENRDKRFWIRNEDRWDGSRKKGGSSGRIDLVIYKNSVPFIPIELKYHNSRLIRGHLKNDIDKLRSLKKQNYEDDEENKIPKPKRAFICWLVAREVNCKAERKCISTRWMDGYLREFFGIGNDKKNWGVFKY